jgi:uncharacterized membrane-anchored protein
MRRPALVAVIGPIAFLLMWAFALSYSLATGTVVRLRIEGYDPRDLLQGRYIRYALIADRAGAENSFCSRARSNQPACACLSAEETGPFHAISLIGSCTERPSDCTVFLKGRCSGGRFTAGIEEYFFAEQFAPVLETIPPDSSIVLAVSSSGHSQVKSLLVGEVPVEEYARRMLQK